MRPLIALGLLVLALSGCNREIDESDEVPADCYTAGCPDGSYCHEGACVGGAKPALPLYLRALPPHGSLQPKVDIGRVEFTIGPVLNLDDITLPNHLEVVTQVRRSDGSAISARAVAWAKGGLEGFPLSFSSTAMDNGGFLLNLAPWWPRVSGGQRTVAHDLQVLPEGEPPLWVASIDSSSHLGVPLPPDGAQFEIAGQLTLSDGLTPLRDVKVVAIDATLGRVSTEDSTDELGAFAVRIWSDDAPPEVTLRISSTDDRRPLPVLTFVVPLPTTEPLTLRFGPLEGTLVQTGIVRGEVGIPGATVRLHGEEIGGGVYEVRTVTDDAGGFEATVFPGRYLLDVEPPLATSYRLTRTEIMVMDGAPIEVVPLPKTPVFGTVVDAAGAPLGNARIVSTLLQSTWPDPNLTRADESAPSRRHEGETDEAGGFALTLDPGTHTLTVSPGDGRGLPTARFTVVVPGEHARAVDTGQLVLPEGAALHVGLVDEAGAPLPGVTLEVWRNDGVGLERVGQSVTDDEGRVTVVVPNL